MVELLTYLLTSCLPRALLDYRVAHLCNLPSGRILMKLVKIIHHVSGNCWKVFLSQRYKGKV